MEDSEEILLYSLASSGVPIPLGVSSIGDLNPSSLVSICSQSLSIINRTPSSPTSLSDDSMSDRFRICTELASAVKDLGFVGDISFHKFLYPSEEDLYKLVRFLVEKLAESSETGVTLDKMHRGEDTFQSTSKGWSENGGDQSVDLNHQEVETKLKDLRLKTGGPEFEGINTKDGFTVGSGEGPDDAEPGFRESSEESTSLENIGLTDIPGDSRGHGLWTADISIQGDGNYVSELEQKPNPLEEKSSEVRFEIEKSSQEKVLKKELTAKTTELKRIEEEHELLKTTVEMAFDEQHSVDFHVMQLNEKIDARRRHLVELESQWNECKPLEEKKRSLEESLYVANPAAQRQLQKLKEVELETQSIISEIRKRGQEHSKLSADLNKHPKSVPRRSYIQRITEITKNSRKQDADIERIQKETRELQLESNSIQERLHRTFAVVDETVFREAKKDPVARQAYRLLTSIHDSFEQISEKIMAADRAQREAAEVEAKLAAMASRSLDIDKLQADLDSIRKENEFLEQCLQ